MEHWAPAVVEDVQVCTARIFQRIRQDRQVIEGLLVVYCLAKCRHRATIPRQPRWVDMP
jgi:hypothetical protein